LNITSDPLSTLTVIFAILEKQGMIRRQNQGCGGEMGEERRKSEKEM
jgi:hypothetical protein